MNTQTVVINKSNVVANSNNTKYVYKFPSPISMINNEIALASLNMYYSWGNMQNSFNNNIFSYMWWDVSGNLIQQQNITIPEGNYSISTLSGYIQSQMLLRGHYLKDTKTQNKVYFISLIENPTYYACQINFTSMFAKGSVDATTNYVNENPPTQVYDTNGNLVWKGWDFPTTKQFPQVLILSTNKMGDFLGFNVGTYPASNIPVTSSYSVLSQIAPNTYPVSAVNIQSNFVSNQIAIPNNILYSFSQGNSAYGDLILKEPQNLIWCKIPDGTYSRLELQFIDQDFNSMKILDNQVNILVMIRDI